MQMTIRKTNSALVIALMAAMVGGMVAASFVFAADNDATQEASTAQATTLHILRKATADTSVTTITFPEGAPNAEVQVPYNDVDGSDDPQVVASSDSEPVVRLKNTSAGSLKAHLSITTWTNSTVAAQNFKLVATTTTNVNAVDDTLSSDGNAATVDTGVTIGADEYRALYLKVTLGANAGKTGNSTITVLGETP